MRIFDLARNDVPAALSYWAEHRARLMRATIPQRSSTIEQLCMLQDDSSQLRRELAARFPSDFVEPLAPTDRPAPRGPMTDSLTPG